jgi:rhamnose transport system substrate-binding protein
MSIFRKLLVTAAFTAAMFAGAAHADNVKIALVVKSLGNGFFDAANKGAQEAAKELGDVEIIYTGPTKATAEGQIEIINTLIAQKVNAIATTSKAISPPAPTSHRSNVEGVIA